MSKSNKIKVLTILTFLAFLNSICLGQDSLTVKYYLKVGLNNNYSVQMVRNEGAIASNNVTAGNAGMLPTIDATGRYSESIISSHQARVVGDSVINTDRADARTTSLSSGINLNWNIFDGFRMFTQYNRLKELKSLGELNTRMTIENLMADIGYESYNYIQQKKRLQTLRYVMTLSKERLNVARERYTIGNISKLEFQQAKVDFNTDSSNYMKQELALISSRINLNRILAINPTSETEVKDSIVIDNDLEYEALHKTTLEKNTSLLISSKNQYLTELEYNLIKSRVYPTLALTGGYSYSRTSDPANYITENRRNGWNYGVGLTFNIFNGRNLHREQVNSKIAIENTKIRYKETEQDIISTLSQIYNQYQNSLKAINLEISNLNTAENNFQIAMERYRLGALSGLEMRDIQRAYLDAEDRLLSAQYQAKLAEISLKLISGRISEYL